MIVHHTQICLYCICILCCLEGKHILNYFCHRSRMHWYFGDVSQCMLCTVPVCVHFVCVHVRICSTSYKVEVYSLQLFLGLILLALVLVTGGFTYYQVCLALY